MLETEVGQGGSRIVLDKFVVEGASRSDFFGMNEVKKGVALMVPAE